MDRPGRLVGRRLELNDLLSRFGSGGGCGTVLVGEPGVGKTRLLAELIKRASRSDLVFVAATASTRSVPFGALASFVDVPVSASVSHVQMIQAIRASVLDSGGGCPPILVVDDLHALDQGSAAVIDRLVRDDDVLLIATHDEEESLAQWVSDLGNEGYVTLQQLLPLDRRDCRELAAGRLESDVVAGLADTLWEVSSGLPFVLLELIDASVDAQTVVQRGGMWRQRGPLTLSDELRRFLDKQVVGLDDAALEAVRIVALAGRLEIRLLEKLVFAVTIEDLERAGLIKIDEKDARLDARMSSSLLGRHLRIGTGVAGRRRLSRELAEGLKSMPMRRAGDLLRLARRRFDAGRLDDPVLALHAARTAIERGDADYAERLARCALDHEASCSALLVLARSVFEQGKSEECDALVTRAEELASTDRERLDVSITRCQLIRRSNGNLEAAVNVMQRAVAAQTVPSCVDEARVELADVLLSAGRLDDSLDLCSALLSSADGGGAAELCARSVRAKARLIAGQLDMVEEDVMVAHQPAAAESSSWSLSCAEHPPLVAAAARLYKGQIAQELSASDLNRDGQTHGLLSGAALVHRGHVQMLAGDVNGSVDSLRRSIEALEVSDPTNHLQDAQVALLLALTQTGHVANLDAELHFLTSKLARPRFEIDVMLERVRAWETCLKGDASGAAERSLKTGSSAALEGFNLAASLAFYDAVRFGCAEVVVDDLLQTTSKVDGALASAIGAHAAAAARGDADGLVRIASTHTRIGANLYAAEAVSSAARLFSRQGDAASSRRAHARSAYLLSLCPGASTPLTAHGEAVLTDRQNQIARLAAHQSNLEISVSLSISVRTVENHLQTIYNTLDVHERGDLCRIFGPEGCCVRSLSSGRID